MQDKTGWSPAEIALRAYQDLRDGQYVNLGIGLPTRLLEAASSAADGKDIVFQSEHGVLGLAAAPAGSPVDRDLIDAGKNPAALVVGGCFVSHAEAFAMIRGGHIDVSVLGAFEVSCAGDVANWSTDPGQDLRTRSPRAVPAVGGAVDLAAGAKSVVVLMKQAARGGTLRLVGTCSLPLTGRGCVTRVYTDLGIFAPAGNCFRVEELAPGIDPGCVAELFANQDVALEWRTSGAAA